METEKFIKIEADTQGAIKSVKDLRNALKEVKDAMAGLEEGSDEWYALAHAAGEYQHQLQAINETVRGASSDFGDMLGNVANVGAGITGAFQTAQAALSMFGVESEEVTKSIKTMQNMMAMTQGLGSIDKAIKSLDKLEESWGGIGRVISKTIKIAAPIAGWVAVISAIGVGFVKLRNIIDGTSKALRERTKEQSDFNAELQREIEIRTKAGDTEDNIISYQIEQLNVRNEKLDESNKKLNEEAKVVSKNAQAAVSSAGAFGGATAAYAAYDGVAQSAGVNVRKNTELIKENNKEIEANKKQIEKLTEQLEINAEARRRANLKEKNGNKKNTNTDSKSEKDNYLSEVERLEMQLLTTEELKKQLSALKEIIKSNTLDWEKKKEHLETLKAQNAEQTEIDKATKSENSTKLNLINNQKKLNSLAYEYYTTIKDTNVLESEIRDLFELSNHRGGMFNEQGTLFDVTRFDVIDNEQFEEAAEKAAEKLGVSIQTVKDIFFEADTQLREFDDLSKRVLNTNKEHVFGVEESARAELAFTETTIDRLEAIYGESVKNTKEYVQLLEQKRKLELEVQNIENENKNLDIELKNFVYDTPGGEHNYNWMYGEITYLKEKISLQEEILENTKKIYGMSSIEYKNELANLKSIKQSLEEVRYAAVNVATQGIGYISDMLGSLADLTDTTTKEGFEQHKKLQVSTAVMNSIGAVVSSWASWMSPANAWMTAPVQIAMATLETAALSAALAAQIKQIQDTKFDSGASSSAVGSLTIIPPIDYSSAVNGADISENTRDTKSYVSVVEIESVSRRVNVAEQESRY